METIDFYQIKDGDTGQQVADGLKKNFEDLQTAIQQTNLVTMNPTSGIVTDEESYNNIIPQSYKTQYPYSEDYDDEFPWLWFNAAIPTGTKLMVVHDSKICKMTDRFAGTTSKVTLSGDKTIATFNENAEYVSWDIDLDLGVEIANQKGLYGVYILDENNQVSQAFYFEVK